MRKTIERKRILLIDDDPNLTLLVKDYLEFRGYKVVTAENDREALEALEGNTPDVTVCCIQGCCDNGCYVGDSDVKADVCMAKPYEPENLVAQVESALEKAARLVQSKGMDSTPKIQVPFNVQLTPKEETIVQLVARGMKNQEIAEELNISQRTVESHVSNMLGKTGLHNRTELARWSLENQIA